MEHTGWANSTDTIAAIATTVGRGALAIVRVSGVGVRNIAEQLLVPAPTIARQATRCRVQDRDGSTVDDVVATLYLAPSSFTGEDILEISTHGGLTVAPAVLAAVLGVGAREAEPGEFTRRAVLNGKIDLLQAEGIGDLIEARSTAARKTALRQLDGGLSERIKDLRGQLLELEALLAYDIDFPEEDDGPVPRARIDESARTLYSALSALLATADAGAIVHEGALVVLAGPPNAGKSSLFNALLGEARAIVTEVPGTTRDAIEAVLDLPGWPLRLVDTAGIRDTVDPVELLGIETSSRYMNRAAVVVACVDSPGAATAVDTLREHTHAHILVARTKCDLLTENVEYPVDVAVSARTGEGLQELLNLIEVRLSSQHESVALDAPILTRTRQRLAVAEATGEMRQFLEAWHTESLPVSVAATHIRVAADALGELIGTIRVDDVLDVLFRSFCVGK